MMNVADRLRRDASASTCRISSNHAAHERLNKDFGVKTTYIPLKGTVDMTTAVLGSQVDGAMSYTAFAINNKGRGKK